jgi:chromosome segregation protein
VFDNADHRAGRRGASFLEIALSSGCDPTAPPDYINNQPVRRRISTGHCFWAPACPALRHHRSGHHQPHHRSNPRNCACFWKNHGRVQVQGTPPQTITTARHRREPTRVEDILRELNANLERLEKTGRSAPPLYNAQTEWRLEQHSSWLLKRQGLETDQTRVKSGHDKGAGAIWKPADLRHIEG